MPTVPGLSTASRAQLGEQEQTKPTPEQLLITAADMHQRGQLFENPTTLGDPRAPLKLPTLGGGRGQRGTKTIKRR